MQCVRLPRHSGALEPCCFLFYFYIHIPLLIHYFSALRSITLNPPFGAVYGEGTQNGLNVALLSALCLLTGRLWWAVLVVEAPYYSPHPTRQAPDQQTNPRQLEKQNIRRERIHYCSGLPTRRPVAQQYSESTCILSNIKLTATVQSNIIPPLVSHH